MTTPPKLKVTETDYYEDIRNTFTKVQQEMAQRDWKVDPKTYENMDKNRYFDVPVLESTRVDINPTESNPSGYINANFVQDTSTTKPSQAYICCQAPLPNTFADFWQMVYEKDSPLVVMLTRLEEKNTIKAHIYWPEKEQSYKDFGHFRVTLLSEEKKVNNVTIRKFSIEKGNPKAVEEFEPSMETGENKKFVIQLHYTEWPDFGVPESTEVMKNLITEVDIRKGQLNQPIVVHCSAGIGRTGAFLAIHMNLKKLLHAQPQIDLTQTFLTLREQRMGMIQSPEQLAFVYATLEDYLQTKFKQVPATHVHHPNIGLVQSASLANYHDRPLITEKDLTQQLEKIMKKRTLSLGDDLERLGQASPKPTEKESNNNSKEEMTM